MSDLPRPRLSKPPNVWVEYIGRKVSNGGDQLNNHTQPTHLLKNNNLHNSDHSEKSNLIIGIATLTTIAVAALGLIYVIGNRVLVLGGF